MFIFEAHRNYLMADIMIKIFIRAGWVLPLLVFFSCQRSQTRTARETPDSANMAVPVLKYGIPVDSFIVEEGTVKNNQYLSQILNGKGVGLGKVDQIVRNSAAIFDVRKIKSGNKFTFFLSPDSVREARYFVYENSATEYFVYELFDSLSVYKGEKAVTKRICTVSGVISSSLWNTMRDNGIDPMLALLLEDIYQWTIDFFAIQKNDRFRVIYEELFVDSVSVGLGEVYAVQFDHYGQENYAFRFFQDNRFDYFDDEGQSLRKAFLKAPLKFSRISSRFSNSRLHPVLRIRRPHHGVDYAAPKGTPVMSIGDGTVIERAYQAGGGGNYVKIKHNSVYSTVYMHLSGFGKGIVQGVRVKQGQVIGFVGSTGLSTGPHLDFRVFRNGSPVDPLKVEAPPVEPVKQENLTGFQMLRDSMMLELQKINWDETQLITRKDQQENITE